MFACVVKEESKNVSAQESKLDQESHGSKNLQNDGLPTTVRCNETDATNSYEEHQESREHNERKISNNCDSLHNHQVELRMDEITSKFKNAFERMAELESLQLSMEEDSKENVKDQWSYECYEHARNDTFPTNPDDGRSVQTSKDNPLVRTKQERLSPPDPNKDSVKIKKSLIENEYNLNRRVAEDGHDVTDDVGGFSTEWSYEEQFKKLYDLGDEFERKDFLDKLFAFMQQRGTPVNRVPIMAKQTLDLYKLFKLVTDRGGLVEVINKKIWRGIIKGLNLPSSVTSAAFTLRTQYMKYLYPYECSTLKLSSPTELQCAIDGNRRDTNRRPSMGHYTTMVDSEVGFYSNPTSPKSNSSSPVLQRPTSPTFTQTAMALRLQKESELETPSFHGNNGIGYSPNLKRMITLGSEARPHFKCDYRAQPTTYTNGRIPTFEPPYKRLARVPDYKKQITFSPWANIKIMTNTDRVGNSVVHDSDERRNEIKETVSRSQSKSPPKKRSAYEENSAHSLCVSIELNGIKYQGTLYAQLR